MSVKLFKNAVWLVVIGNLLLAAWVLLGGLRKAPDKSPLPASSTNAVEKN